MFVMLPPAAASDERLRGRRRASSRSASAAGGRRCSSSATSTSTGAAGWSSSRASSSRCSTCVAIGVGIGGMIGDGPGARRHADPVRAVRRAGAARDGLDERRDRRVDVQRVLQAQLREDVRRDPLDAARRRRRRPGRDRLVGDPRRRSTRSGFMVVILVLGLVASPWAIFAVPAATLLAFAFAAVGMARRRSCAAGRTST